jgi:hypothetical protein
LRHLSDLFFDFTFTQEEQCFLEVFPNGLKGVQFTNRWNNVLDPSVLRGFLSHFEFNIIFEIQKRLQKPNAWAFIGRVLERSGSTFSDFWSKYRKKLYKLLANATGRPISSDLDLVGENGMYDFGSPENYKTVVDALWKDYSANNNPATNDPRRKTEATLTNESLLRLIDEHNAKKQKTMEKTAKRRATEATKAERDSKRLKKETKARSLLKPKREGTEMQDKAKNSDLAKKKDRLLKKIRRAGHEHTMRALLASARVAFEKAPLAPSISESLTQTRAKRNKEKLDEARKFLQDATNKSK